MSIKRSVAAALPLFAACCAVPPPEPAPAPTPSPPPVVATPASTPTPAQPVYDNWSDIPRAAGVWVYRLGESGESRATFVDPMGTPLFQMICTAGRQMVVARIVPGSGAREMTIFTETQQTRLDAEARSGSTIATIATLDPLLDAMAFSRGRFAIEVPGTNTVALPPWAEVSRVIEDCR